MDRTRVVNLDRGYNSPVLGDIKLFLPDDVTSLHTRWVLADQMLVAGRVRWSELPNWQGTILVS